MKRSEIQSAVAQAKQAIANIGFSLPIFAHWSLEDWRSHRAELSAIAQTMRGWDVTDFNGGDFDKEGAVLFTIRNGIPNTDIGCPYAEKLIVMREGQTLPYHFHFSKTEDIINRGGGILVITVYNSLPDESMDMEKDVEVFCDGIRRVVPAGTGIEILPGNSMTIRPYMYHKFSIKPNTGTVVAGEVSAINDDNIDNRFAVPKVRFSEIEEDEPILFPLCNEIQKLVL